MVDSLQRVRVALRLLRGEDIPQVAEIEKEAFPTIWSATPFRRELSNRRASYLVASIPKSQSQNGQDRIPPARISASEAASSRWRLGRLLSSVKNIFPTRIEPEVPVDYHILGYVGMWFMAEEAHITAIAVRGKWRGKGLGELLLIGSIEVAMERPSQVVSLEVRVSNVVAQTLYEKYGFARAGTRRRYYTDNNEDAVIMNTDAINTPLYRQRFKQLKRAYEQRHGEIITALE